jgi:hypothetical protein
MEVVVIDRFDVLHNEAIEARKKLGLREPDVPTVPLFVGLLILFSTMAGVKWVIDAAPAAYADKTPLAYVLAMTLTIALGAFVYLSRNVLRKPFIYPPVELGISLMLAYGGVTQTKEPLLTLIALLAASRVAADSIKNFREFRAEEIARAKAAKKE